MLRTDMMKKLIKQAIGVVSNHNPFLLKRIASGLTVFAFHDVNNQATPFQKKYGLAISVEEFEQQIDWIKLHFKVVSPSLLINPNADLSGSALITFDDGYAGTFNNALPILKRKGCESLLFLNIGNIENRVPLLPGLVSYLYTHSVEFCQFCEQHNLSVPYQHSISPALLASFSAKYDLPSYEIIEAYSGEMATKETLERWDCPGVFYGNHLYEHWSFSSLSSTEFNQYYLDNQRALSQYSNHIDLFSFTYGVHPDLKDAPTMHALKKLGMQRAFTTKLGINSSASEFYLGRVAFSSSENNNASRWFRLARS